jgi:hypothetical protein
MARVLPSTLLKDKLVALRRKHVGVAASTGIAMAMLMSAAMLAAVMFLDWWLDLAWGVRLVLLFAQAGVVVYILLRFVLTPVARQPDDDTLALMVEKARPVFRSRLIASIQLTRPDAIPPGASAMLVDAMVEQTEAMAEPMEFQRVVPTGPLKKTAAWAIVSLLVGLVLFVSGGVVTRDLLKRAFLSTTPVPRKTRLDWASGNLVIGRGDNVKLEATAKGILPPAGRIQIKSATRRDQEFTLERDQDAPGKYSRTIENVQESFAYVIRLGDSKTVEYKVEAIPRPTVTTIQCDQSFPAYTKLPPARRSLGDLNLLAGSKLSLQVGATKDIRIASVKLVGLDQEALLRVNLQNPRALTGEITIPAKAMTGFQIQMTDTQGMESRDSAVYRVEIIPDKAPVVRITYPDRKEELFTRQATMVVGLDATDDFEISKVRLRYKIKAPEEGEERAIELDLGGDARLPLKRRFERKIESFDSRLTEGSVIEYWLEAEDNNDATGPGVGTSEHQLARVVSESEKRADLWARAGDFFGNITDVTSDQEKANKVLGTIILEKSGMK